MATRREKLENDWSSLQVCAGAIGVLLCGPGLLVALVPGFHDTLLGDDPLGHFGLSWMYISSFGTVFAISLIGIFVGLRGATRPPSLLYRLTHPRLPHWAGRRRSAWPVS